MTAFSGAVILERVNASSPAPAPAPALAPVWAPASELPEPTQKSNESTLESEAAQSSVDVLDGQTFAIKIPEWTNPRQLIEVGEASLQLLDGAQVRESFAYESLLTWEYDASAEQFKMEVQQSYGDIQLHAMSLPGGYFDGASPGTQTQHTTTLLNILP